jgi:hypothetical protein
MVKMKRCKPGRKQMLLALPMVALAGEYLSTYMGTQEGLSLSLSLPLFLSVSSVCLSPCGAPQKNITLTAAEKKARQGWPIKMPPAMRH